MPEHRRERQRIAAVPNAVDTAKFAAGGQGRPSETCSCRPTCRWESCWLTWPLTRARRPPSRRRRPSRRAALWFTSGWPAPRRDGAGASRSRLLALFGEPGVADRVWLLGQRGDAADLLRAADVFLLPSTCEGLPLSMLEAQVDAAASPSWPPRRRECPEVIRDGTTGFLIRADDPDVRPTANDCLMTLPGLTWARRQSGLHRRASTTGPPTASASWTSTRRCSSMCRPVLGRGPRVMRVAAWRPAHTTVADEADCSPSFDVVATDDGRSMMTRFPPPALDGRPTEGNETALREAYESMKYHQFLVSRDIGGAGLVALGLAKLLRSQGRESPVWIPGTGPAWAQAERLGLPVESYDLNSASSPSNIKAAGVNWQVWSQLRKTGRGLVHVHSPHAYGALRRGLAYSGLKQVVHVHLEQEEQEGLRWALKYPPGPDHHVAQFLVDQVRRALPEHRRERQRIAAVPNAVDTAKFAPGDKAEAKRKVGAPAGVPLALMLANLAPHKGQETAIKAAAVLKARGVRFTSGWRARSAAALGLTRSVLHALIQEAGRGRPGTPAGPARRRPRPPAGGGLLPAALDVRRVAPVDPGGAGDQGAGAGRPDGGNPGGGL